MDRVNLLGLDAAALTGTEAVALAGTGFAEVLVFDLA